MLNCDNYLFIYVFILLKIIKILFYRLIKNNKISYLFK